MTRPAGPARIVVTGKGGVGKTTLTAALARLLARAGHTVVAVDGDVQCNLGRTLGLPPWQVASITPLSGNRAYTDETVGAAGGLVRLNPDVSDVVDRFAVGAPDGVRLLVMGGLTQVGGGCLCPESSLLAATVAQLGRGVADVVVLDTPAGVEHFGRALARGFDVALVVTDPTTNAGDVAQQTGRLARRLGLPRVDLVVNRARGNARPAWLSNVSAAAFDVVHAIPFDAAVLDTEPSVDAVLSGGSAFAAAVTELAAQLARVRQEARA